MFPASQFKGLVHLKTHNILMIIFTNSQLINDKITCHALGPTAEPLLLCTRSADSKQVTTLSSIYPDKFHLSVNNIHDVSTASINILNKLQVTSNSTLG